MINYGIKLFKSETSGLSAIRNREDAAITVLIFMKSMFNIRNHDPNDTACCFYYPDLNRFIWEDENNSIHSLIIPWKIVINEVMGQGIPNYKEIEWKYEYFDELMYLFRELKEHDVFSGGIDKLIDIYSDMLQNFSIYNKIDEHNLWALFISLYVYEPGYIRYDFDPERENGHVHPRHHLDINYSKHGTYKIGLCKEMTIESLTEFIDLSTDCYYACRANVLGRR